MNRMLMMGAMMHAMHNIGHADPLGDDYIDHPKGPQPKKSNRAGKPLEHVRQKPKEKSDSLKKMLGRKGRA